MALQTDTKKIEVFQKHLLIFYEEHGRKNLPWRITKNPYLIMVAEFMLQKTTSAQASKVYPIFLDKYPTVSDLAVAREEEIEESRSYI